MMSSFLFYFFFSSRRRHTRCSRDWSSDVCSSDLMITQPAYQDANGVPIIQANVAYSVRVKLARQGAVTQGNQIGRASCRERGVDLGGRRIIKKKKKRINELTD